MPFSRKNRQAPTVDGARSDRLAEPEKGAVPMLLIRSAQELMRAFRPRDLRIFEVPDEDVFPLLVRDFRAWVESGGARVYLVYEDPAAGEARGVVLRRSESALHGTLGHMCDFCHSTGSADEIGLLTAEESANRTVGIVVCRDLRCGERVEEACNRAGKDVAEARRRIVERIARFANEALGMDRRAAGR
jgi:hypothetical protein